MILTRTAVIISLARRADRRRQLRRTWPLSGVRLKFFTAFDDPDDPNRGCMKSHIIALSTTPDEPTLMLEDDAIFAPDFTLDLNPPEDWDLLWLGGQHLIRPKPAEPGWVRPSHIIRTHGYLTRKPHQLSRYLRDSPLPHTTMFALPLTQYAQSPFTVGQAPGHSDTRRGITTGSFYNDPCV